MTPPDTRTESEPPELQVDPGASALGSAADIDADDDAGAGAGKAKKTGKGLGFGAWLAIGWIVTIAVASILAPYLPLADPAEADIDNIGAGPSLNAPLGGDGIGQDVFAQVIFGARASLQVAFYTVLAGFVIGGFFGMIAGYYRGKLDRVLIGVFDIMLSFPQIVLALAILAFLGQGLFNVVLALTIVTVPILARITRANTLSWAQREFVLAARVVGTRDRRIMWRGLLPNVLPAMLSIAFLAVAIVIVAEGTLALLGVGVRSEYNSWGNLIALARTDLEDAPMGVFGPAGAIFLTVLALNYLGDVIRNRFDVRGSAL